MNRVIAFVLGFILFGCSKEQCVYEDYFINNQTDDKPTVYVVSSNNSCNFSICGVGSFFSVTNGRR